jgi:hypothetical protein
MQRTVVADVEVTFAPVRDRPRATRVGDRPAFFRHGGFPMRGGGSVL